MNSFFSIIIPTFNRLPLLQRAVTSVLSQNYTDYEIIIINDASTDGTKQWLDQQVNDKLIILHNSNNLEKSESRNLGIRTAKGKYICFLDDDDEYLDNHLSIFSNAIQKQKNNCALFFSQPQFVRDDIAIKYNYPVFSDFTNAVEYFFTIGVQTSLFCIHTNILKQYTFNASIKIAEDLDLCLRIVNTYPAYPILEHTVKIYKHDNNITNQQNIEKDVLYALRIICFNKLYKEKIPKVKRYQTIAKVYFDAARYYEQKNYFLVIQYLALAVFYNSTITDIKTILQLIIFNFPLIGKYFKSIHSHYKHAHA